MKLDNMKGLKRTHYCAQIPLETGTNVTVCGFADRVRDAGHIIFINLRDRTGIVQLTFNDETDREIFEKAKSVRGEYVLMAQGTVRPRDSVNEKLVTGAVEIAVSDLRILSVAQTPPFEISGSQNVNEELRLKYRYLDLRSARLQRNIIMRHEIVKAARKFFYDNGFIEIETPMLMRSTPEGARDYLVPSRIHAGSFYALPQSPQLYKQLLMVAGFDRYVQIARCFRDEDLRADRQPEFTQVDLEMSFTDVEGLVEIGERFLAHVVKSVLGKDIPLPMPRMTYAEAMNSYGSDKPDIRFEMKIKNITENVRDIDFGVFASAIESGGSVRAIVAKNAAETYTRKEIDKLTEHAKGIGAKGLAYIRWTKEGANCSFKKFLSPEQLDKLLGEIGAGEGDLVLIAADKDRIALPVLGALRNIIAARLGIIPEDKLAFAVITQMPFFEYDDETGKWIAMHHPFTMPMEECLDSLESDPASVRAQAFDFVVNGTELCSGSMRITDCALQQKMFELLGMTDEEIAAKFGFLVDAYKYGAPPHGGFGFGVDRLSMILCGADSLRDVTAFPKVQNASELMSACPSPVDPEQLAELSIALANSDANSDAKCDAKSDKEEQQ